MIQLVYIWVYTQKNWKQDLKGILYIHVHSSIIHNRKGGEEPKLFYPLIDEWKNKMWAIYKSTLKIPTHATALKILLQ